MKIKQLKQLIDKYSDDIDVFIVDGNGAQVYNIDEDLFLLAGEKLNGLAIISDGDEYLNPIFEFFPSEKREKIYQNMFRIDDYMDEDQKNLVNSIK